MTGCQKKEKGGDKVLRLASVSCSGLVCDSQREYCLTTVGEKSDIVFSKECVPKAVNCNSCGCSIEDAKKQFSNSDNCSAWIRCEKKGEQLAVACFVPGY